MFIKPLEQPIIIYNHLQLIRDNNVITTRKVLKKVLKKVLCKYPSN